MYELHLFLSVFSSILNIMPEIRIIRPDFIIIALFLFEMCEIVD